MPDWSVFDRLMDASAMFVLRRGSMNPKLFLVAKDASDKIHLVVFADIGPNPPIDNRIRALGVHVAASHLFREFLSLGWISEAWEVDRPEGRPIPARPSLEPDRFGILMGAAYDIASKQGVLDRRRMDHDSSGRLFSLEQLERVEGLYGVAVVSRYLSAFIDGLMIGVRDQKFTKGIGNGTH